MVSKREKLIGFPELAGYYVGMNFFLIVAIIFLISASQLKKKLRTKEKNDDIDSIGKY